MIPRAYQPLIHILRKIAMIMLPIFLMLAAQTVYWSAKPMAAAVAYAAEGDDLLLSIVPVIAAQSRVKIYTPGNGDLLTAGSVYSITWDGPDTGEIDILLSTDGGASYPYTVATGVPKWFEIYTWQPVPFYDLKESTLNCKIRIDDTDRPQHKLAESAEFILQGSMSPRTLWEIYDINDDIANNDGTDSDGDGLYDNVEIYLGTDPNHPDSDRDGIFDDYEIFGDGSFNTSDPVPDRDGDDFIAALDADDDGVPGHDGLLEDADGDGIANYLEYYGYVYDNLIFQAWDGTGEDYFKTDPTQPSTDGDHYADNVEASGVDMDRSITPPGNHPCVPAFPNIIAWLVGYKVTLDTDITEISGKVHTVGQEWNVTTTRSSAATAGIHWDVSASLECGWTGCNANVSHTVGVNMEQTLTKGVSRSGGGNVMDAEEWSVAACTNPSSAAKIALTLEAENIGGCRAENVSFNLNLWIGDELIESIPGGNHSVSYIDMGETTSPWEIDDISITYKQLRLLETGAPVAVEVTDVMAEVMYKNGGLWVSGGNWSSYMPEIEAISAHFYLDLGDGRTTEHMVYADDSPYAPEVTVSDALRWLANAEESDEGPLVSFYQSNGALGEPEPLDGWYWYISAEGFTDTYDRIDSYLSNLQFQLFDMVLEPHMTVVAKAPPAYPTPAIHWGVLSPRDGMVRAYVEDYFFSDPAQIEVVFVDKYGAEHAMRWRSADGEGYYECGCPTNDDGTDYYRGGSEKIVATNAMYGNPGDPASSNYRTEMPVAEMRYLPTFNYPNNWKYQVNLPGWARDVKVSDGYAYVAGREDGLHVIDVRDPSNAILLNTYDTPGDAQDVFISGTRAYVADGEAGLRIFDISDPTGLEVLDVYDTMGSAIAVVVNEDYAYVGDGTYGLLRIVNVTVESPAYLTAVGSCEILGSPFSILVSDDYAYIAGGTTGGLQVVDVSTPSSPTPRGACDTPGGAYDVYVRGQYAFVADGNAGLQIIDIRDPWNPELVSSYLAPDSCYFISLAVYGDFAFVGDWTNGLRVINIRDPHNPTLAGEYLGVSCASVQVIGDHAYLACEFDFSFLVLDVSDPTSPNLPFAWGYPEYSHDVYVDGNHAYIARGENGIAVIDVNNPATPTFLGGYDTTGCSTDVFYCDGYAYVAAFDSGLQVIDVRVPARPELVYTIDPLVPAWDVYVRDGYAYVARGSAGIQIIQFQFNGTDIIDYKIVNTVDTYDAKSIVVSGDYAFVADGVASSSADGGLKMIDISNPDGPAIVGYYKGTPDGYIASYDVFVQGDYAYVIGQNCYGDYDDKLWVIDISVPGTSTTPLELRQTGELTPGITFDSMVGIFVIDGYAFLAGSYDGFQVVDVHDPASPISMGVFDTPGYAASVFPVDDCVYVAGRNPALFVMKFQ